MSVKQELEQKSLMHTPFMIMKKGSVDVFRLPSAHNTRKIEALVYKRTSFYLGHRPNQCSNSFF